MLIFPTHNIIILKENQTIMKNKIIYVSGVVNFETIIDVDSFPIFYCPIEYPFFGVNSGISGQAYNVAKALKTLGGNEVIISGLVGKDLLGKVVVDQIKKLKIDASLIKDSLEATPNSVSLVDRDNNVKTYMDLKEIQEINAEVSKEEEEKLAKADIVVLSNSNFNRPLLKKAKELGKKVATDVHIIGTVNDDYNADFMAGSDILFLSKKGLDRINYEDFLISIYEKYHNEIIVLGEGREGAMILDAKKHVIYHIDAITLREIVNTVGSRDALFSAFIHFYLRNVDSLEALELSEVFTSYKIGEAGGSNGFLTQKEVKDKAKAIDFDVYKIKEF